MAMPLVRLEPLAREVYLDTVRRALNEDIRDGDITTDATVPLGQQARGLFIVKSDCVLAGLEIAFEAFRQLDPGVRVSALRHDGDACRTGEEVASVAGSARALLIGERTALNFLQRLSGIATRARRFVDASGGRITILDTRKTTPTLRTLEKYAVRAGGGTPSSAAGRTVQVFRSRWRPRRCRNSRRRSPRTST
jgi:nicotinate-nucleotide pyrophosphorylase (carboxylating)